MKLDTFICNTCKKAIDVPTNPAGISMFPRCVITKNCKGLLSNTDKQFVSDDQYHTARTSTDAWIKRPLMFNHTQTASRTRWIVEHNLGTVPIISVFSYAPQLVLVPADHYTIELEDEYRTVIVFKTPISGQVQCIVRQSTTKNIVPNTSTTYTNNNDVPLLYNGAIVIASILSTIDTVQLTVNSNSKIHLVLTANISALASTPWQGAAHVIIGNVRYNVFGINATPLFSSLPDATTSFWVDSINNSPVQSKSSFLLLANAPFNHHSDRVLSNTVDISHMVPINQASMSLVGGSLYCAKSLLTSVYPPMESNE